MPINEAGGYRRSNLTRQQQREAELAVYGRSPESPSMSPQTQQFTQAQLDQMRAILAQHDGQNAGVVKEFDLNNPPQQRYVHQEYPKFLYHHEKRTHKIVRSKDEEDGFLKLGYELKPYPAEVPELELDGDDAAEVAALKAEIEVLKKKQPKK